jgi:hypothetical protein
VLLYQNDYEEKINTLLSGTNTYEVIIVNIYKKVMSTLRNKDAKIIDSLHDKKVIDNNTRLRMKSADVVNFPAIYAAIKIHKTIHPARPIVGMKSDISTSLSYSLKTNYLVTEDRTYHTMLILMDK